MWPNSQPSYSWGPYMAQHAGGFGNSDQVDWATLAKQWMQHRDMVGLAPSQDMHQHSATNDNEASQNQVWFPPAGGCAPQQQQTVIFSDMENYNSLGSTTQSVIQQPNEVTSNRSMPPWAVPPPPPPLPEPIPECHINNFTLDEHNFNANQFDQNSFPLMWNQPSVPVASPKIFNQPRPDFNFSSAWMSGTSTGAVDTSFLDANKRKMLPAWIREGLEKMERQKFKQMERERMEQSVISDDTGFENQTSAFLSQEEEEESEKEYEEENEEKSVAVVEDVIKKEIEEEENLSEEEKLARLMLKVRRMMTEILLEVTNEEISSVSGSVYLKAKSRQAKAPTQALVSSSALASISALGGDYESEDEDDEEGEKNQVDSSSDEDIEVAREKIEKKMAAFDARMKLLEFEDEKVQENKPSHSDSTMKDPDEDSRSEKVDIKSERDKQEVDDKKTKNHKKYDSHRSKSKRTPSTSSSSSSSSESDTSSESSSAKRHTQKKKPKEKTSKISKEKTGNVAERRKRSTSRSRVSRDDDKRRMCGKMSGPEHSRKSDRVDSRKSGSSERYSKHSSRSLRNENREDMRNNRKSERDRNEMNRKRDSTGERRKRKRSEDRADSEERNKKREKKEKEHSRRYKEKIGRRESRRESRSRSR